MTPYNEDSIRLKPYEKEQIKLNEQYEDKLKSINWTIFVKEYWLYKLIYVDKSRQWEEHPEPSMISATSADLIITVLDYLSRHLNEWTSI